MMNKKMIREILKNTDCVHVSGSGEEKKTAEYLRSVCEGLGAKAFLEEFEVDTATVQEAVLEADGKEIPCRGYKLCGSGSAEAPLCYMPNTDPASLAGAKGKIIMVPGNWTNPCEKGREHGSMYTKERSYLPCHAQSTHRNSRPRS